MKLEAGKEMDRRCVMDWLNEVYVTPSRAFISYTDDELKMFAHDALVLLKEQEAKQAIKQIYHVMMNRDYENPVEVTRYDWLCPTCKSLLCRDIDVIDDNYHFCKVCGQAVTWE